jgi:alpha-glucosidase (family GH31 glycosyl hydrolase)
MKIKIAFLLVFGSLATCCFSADYMIKDNSLLFKDVSFQILTPTMVRIQKTSNRTCSPTTDLGVVNETFIKVPFNVNYQKPVYSIQTDSLTILYNPSLELTHGGIQVLLKHNPYYVLTSLDKKDTLNLGGVIGSLDNCKGNVKFAEQNDVSSKSQLHLIPDGILSRRGFTVLKHTKDTLYLYTRGDQYQDLYVLGYGNNFKLAFTDFYRVAGKIPMLPKWSFGFIYSRWADYKANDYKRIVTAFRQEKMPIDAIILDMCWHVDYWYGYRYDTNNFPDMKAFHNWTDSVHVKTGFNHHSGCIYAKDPHILEFCKQAGIDFNKALIPGLSWEPDKKVIHYDTKDSIQFKAFYDIYLSPLIRDGLDFHWVDGEGSIYSSELYQNYLGNGTQKRPIVMNRLQTDVLCNHRYPVGFSGDTFISWETMGYSLEATIKGGNNGVYWSHDIGGYMPQGPAGYPPTGELYARWLQLGAVSPIFRVHAKKDVYWTPPRKPGEFDQGSRLPWEWGDTVLRSARTTIQLRYKLLPYIYSMTRKAHDTGIPLCRGLYIDYPQPKDAYRYDEFLFGDNFLAAPVMNAAEKGADGITGRTVWLPEGEWYDYFTGKNYQGNQELQVTKSLFEFPLFIKAGSIIPMAPYHEYSGVPLDTLSLVVYTPSGTQKSTFNLYEDDGESFKFEKDQYRWVTLSYEYINQDLQKIIIHKPTGDFQESVQNRAYTIDILNTSEPKIVHVNDSIFTNWHWNPANKKLTLELGKQNVKTDIMIDVKI